MMSRRAADSKVLLAGAGGLGHFTLVQLLRSGVGEVHVVDPDVVEEKNLGRQFLFRKEDVGKEKAKVLEERLRGSGAEIRGIVGRVEDVDLHGYDLVLDCMDTWDSKMRLIARAAKEDVPVVFMSAGNGVGMVSVPTHPLPFKAKSPRDVSPGELAVTAGMGFTEATRILGGEDPLLLDKLLVFDLRSLEFLVLHLPKIKIKEDKTSQYKNGWPDVP